MKIVEDKKLEKIATLFYVVAVLAVSYGFATARIACCDYVSINGDFQSYNVFRRMLAGQTPYVDFSNYIGMSPVAMNLPFLLNSGKFADSLFVTNFTSNVIFLSLLF
jgi:hypothetical protein